MRIVLSIGVAYGSDPDLVERLLTEAARTHPKVLSERPVLVHFRAFGASSLDWEVRFFVEKPGDRLRVTHDVLRQLDQSFRDHGIDIPFPQHDARLRTTETVMQGQIQDDGRSSPEAVDMQTPTASTTEP